MSRFIERNRAPADAYVNLRCYVTRIHDRSRVKRRYPRRCRRLCNAFKSRIFQPEILTLEDYIVAVMLRWTWRFIENFLENFSSPPVELFVAGCFRCVQILSSYVLLSIIYSKWVSDVISIVRPAYSWYIGNLSRWLFHSVLIFFIGSKSFVVSDSIERSVWNIQNCTTNEFYIFDTYVRVSLLNLDQWKYHILKKGVEGKILILQKTIFSGPVQRCIFYFSYISKREYISFYLLIKVLYTLMFH